MKLLVDVALLALAFGLGVAAAELAGAESFGVACGVGQVVFALGAVGVLLLRD